MDFQKVKILVVEDSIQDFLIFKELIGQIREFFVHLEHASSMESAQKLIHAHEFDIIFLDLYLPDSQGVESFEKLSKLVTAIPVVILSGLSDKNIARDIVKMGAQDFIVKNEFDSNLLEKAITYSIERKKYQDILQKSEARYRTTFESVGVAIGEYDYTLLRQMLEEKRKAGVTDILKDLSLDLKSAIELRNKLQVMNINDEVLHLFEMSDLEEFRNNTHLIYTEDTVEHLERMILAIWNEEDYFEQETTYRTKFGHLIQVLNRMRLLGDDFGYYRALISVVNISRLKRTEQEVRNQSRLLQAVSESAGAMLSTDSFIEGVDAALALLLKGINAEVVAFYCGCHSENQLQEFSFHCSDEQYRSKLPANLNPVELPEVLAQGKFVNVKKGDSKKLDNLFLDEYFSDLALVPIVLFDKLWGVIAVMRNNSEAFSAFENSSLLTVARNLGAAYSRHEAREELEKLNQELEQRVKDRTEQLESTNKELESFSYSVSHDLRAPLRAINGFTSVLAEEYESVFDDQGRHFLNNVKRGAKDMSNLIEDLLHFSRLGRKPIQMTAINMESLTKDVVTTLKGQSPDKEVEVNLRELKQCQGDKSMVRQVLINFIGNAIKYSRKGETIRIEVGSEAQGDLVEYYIKDNGVGFDMKYVDKIFGVFQRLHQDTQFEGTGVGLAIVQRIVTRHGGQVRAEGEENNGATFYFSLPAAGSNQAFTTGKVENTHQEA